MKKILFLLIFVFSLASCATKSLCNKEANYEVISASARGFNKQSKATSYDAIIKIGKKYYNAVLDNKLNIIEVQNSIDFKSTEKTLAI